MKKLKKLLTSTPVRIYCYVMAAWATLGYLACFIGSMMSSDFGSILVAPFMLSVFLVMGAGMGVVRLFEQLMSLL